ncbi:MAG: sugar-binding domain-containing protein, partial [Anaerotignaceae bacterium]
MLYPVLTNSRTLIDLSGVWDFALDTDEKGFEEKWYANVLTNPMTMPVPASYNDLKDGVDFRDHYGWVFYQRYISVPKFLASERVVLRMAAVTHYAKVYLNGELICEHKGGFLPFEVEINDFIKSGDNLLTIAVDNKIDHSTLPVGSEGSGGMGNLLGMGEVNTGKKINNPNFDFFNYCGITRPVKIYTTPKSYIADITLVPSVNGKDATIAYKVDTVGEGECKVEVFTKDGVLVATSNGIAGNLEIKDVTLWQPLKAYLYQVKVTFNEDEYTLPYGVRTVKVEGNKFL